MLVCLNGPFAACCNNSLLLPSASVGWTALWQWPQIWGANSVLRVWLNKMTTPLTKWPPHWQNGYPCDGRLLHGRVRPGPSTILSSFCSANAGTFGPSRGLSLPEKNGGTDVWCGAVSLFGLLISHSCNLKVDFLKNKCDASKRKKGFLFPDPLFSLHWFI